jgi:hypothetical protein
MPVANMGQGLIALLPANRRLDQGPGVLLRAINRWQSITCTGRAPAKATLGLGQGLPTAARAAEPALTLEAKRVADIVDVDDDCVP